MLLQRTAVYDAGTCAFSQAGKRMVRNSAGGRSNVSLHRGQSLLSDFLIPKVYMPTMWMGFILYPRNKNFHGTGVMEPNNSILLLRDFGGKKVKWYLDSLNKFIRCLNRKFLIGF